MEKRIFIDKRYINKGLETLIGDKIDQHFLRYHSFIHKIHVTLRDINGRKGGIDKQCQILIKCKKAGTILLTKQSENAASALQDAIKAIKHVYRKKINR